MFRYILIFLVIFTMRPAWGLSYSTPEGVAIHNIALAIQVYKTEHGRLPETWNDLMSIFEKPIDKTFPYVLPAERYAFVSAQVKLPDSSEGRIILIRRSSFRDAKLSWGWFGITHGLRNFGRHVIYENPSGEILSRYLEENEVQALFQAAHVSLPESDQLGLTQPETDYKNKQLCVWGFLAFFGIGLAFYLCSSLSPKIRIWVLSHRRIPADRI